MSPPAIATSFNLPGTRVRSPEPVLDNDDRSFTGANTFKRDP